MEGTVVRAALYVRKSTEPGETNRSLDLQVETCTTLCDQHGYSVTATLKEIVSAYDPRARRAKFAELARLVESEAVDVIVSVALDRLGRRVSETAKLLESCRDHGVLIHTSRDGVLDPNDPTRGFIFNVYAAIAEQEAATTSARIRADKISRAREGGWVGGTPPYGYTTAREGRLARLVPREGEIEILRTAIAEVMQGAKSTGEVARLLNEAGKVTRTGKPWTTNSVQRMLAQPALAGWQAYKPQADRHRSHWDREPFRDELGKPIAVGEAILSPDEYDRLQRLIARKTRYSRAEASLWTPLLRGLIACSCGRPMYPTAQRQTRSTTGEEVRYTRYICRGAAEKVCTNSISGVVDHVALRYVSVILKDGSVERAWKRAESRRRAQLEATGGPLASALLEAQDRAKAFERALGEANSRDVPTIAQHLGRARDEAEALQRELAEALEEVQAPSPAEVMEGIYSGTPEHQRSAIQAVLERVVIHPGGKLSLAGKTRTTSTVDIGRVQFNRRGAQMPFRMPAGSGVEALG
nr:recombinase family protein [Enemella evansiae]